MHIEEETSMEYNNWDDNNRKGLSINKQLDKFKKYKTYIKNLVSPDLVRVKNFMTLLKVSDNTSPLT